MSSACKRGRCSITDKALKYIRSLCLALSTPAAGSPVSQLLYFGLERQTLSGKAFRVHELAHCPRPSAGFLYHDGSFGGVAAGFG